MSTPVTPPSFATAAGLVAAREIRSRLQSRAFVIGFVVLIVVVLGGVMLGKLLGAPGSSTVAVVGAAEQAVSGVPDLKTVQVDDRAAGEKLLRAGEVDAVVVPTGGPAPALTVVGLDSAPVDVVQALSLPPDVELLDPSALPPGLAAFVSIAFGVLFFAAAMTFGTMMAQSVVEEKQTRIVEILLASVPVRALLTGKVLGNSLLAFGQVLGVAAAALIGMALTDQSVLLGQLGPSVVWFVVFFVVGFVLLASLYAAAGSLVSRSEDIGSATAPVMYLVMIPYFLVIFFNGNPTVLAIMSYVPFSAPIGMPVRLFLGTAEWWEPLLSLGALVATTAVVIAIASRVYGNSLLRMGGRVKLGEALRQS